MSTAVTNLEMALSQLRSRRTTDRPEYAPIVSGLLRITDQLTAIERRDSTVDTAPVNLALVLREALMAAAATIAEANRLSNIRLAREAWVPGPAKDLRDLVTALVEYALTVGCTEVAFQSGDNHEDPGANDRCSIRFELKSSEIPEFLRQKLWHVASSRHGEVSTVTEANRSRISIALPLERRRMAG
jgi:hypothetical protein